METIWELDTLLAGSFSSHKIIGPEGSGDYLDHEKLMKVRNYVATLRGIVIHEITSLEDKILDSVYQHLETDQVSGFVAKEYLLSIRESFEKKKQLIRKLHAAQFDLIAEENDFKELDWLQEIRNDLAHGREFVHSSYRYVEVVNKMRCHRLPDSQLIDRFHQALGRWHKILNDCQPNKASEATGTSSVGPVVPISLL